MTTLVEERSDRPPRYCHAHHLKSWLDGGETKLARRYRLAVDAPLPRAWTISRADLAAAMVAAVRDSTTVRHTVSIAA